MKNLLIVIALVLVAAGVYWKFRDSIHGKIDEVKKTGEDGSGTPAIVPAAKNVSTAPSTPKADEKLSLVSAEFVRGLPDSLTTITAAGGAKPDLIIELTAADESGGGLPPQIQLTPNVSLDTTAVRLPAGAKDGAMVLVHLQSVSPANADVSTPQFAVQCAAEPVAPSLEAAIRAQRWRSSASPPASSAARTRSTTQYLWASEFAEKSERNELQGGITVEGTFGRRQRGSGTAATEVVTLEEAKNIEFHISRRSAWLAQVDEAEKQKRKGHRVTLKLFIDANQTPKYSVHEVRWGIPIKAQQEYWTQVVGGKKRLGDSLALAAWADTRALNEEAKAMYATARSQVTREAVGQMGRPTRGIRIHLSDEVDDQWFYDLIGLVQEMNHHPNWEGKPFDSSTDFYGAARPFFVSFKTNPRGDTTGDYFLIQR